MLSLGSLTLSWTVNFTTARPFWISAELTRPTSTPASFTSSPLNTPEASANTACTA